MSKPLELRFCKVMLFKNDSHSESDLETFFLKGKIIKLDMQAVTSLRSVISLAS